MIFTELRFLDFFAVVFAVHWLLRGDRLRQAWLLFCSYAFYAAWDSTFLVLIWFSTVLDYGVGLALEAARDKRRRDTLLAVSIVGNLSVLGVFKYYDFFVGSAASLLAWLGIPASMHTLGIVVPVGISFYTFQTLSYSIDVHAGRIRAERDPLRLALFVAFFPQLVAGPIVRARHFLPQLERPRRLAQIRFQGCLALFLVGFVKKACISDRVAGPVDAYFADPAAFDAASAWVASALYAVQIYCDFSGYSDMAIACAGLLGYNLCKNFDAPYLAPNITLFWRRWHISLSTWLRDYLYIPLGGNRGSLVFRYRNVMITMLLGGLWHGAAWTFVIWGALHGAALLAHREWTRRVPAGGAPGPLALAAGILATQAWVCLAWIFFRSPDLATAQAVLGALIGWSPGSASLDPAWLALPVLLAAAQAAWRARPALPTRPRPQLPAFAFSAAYAVAVLAALAFVRSEARPFIYFQF